jgi:hypothetical protein
VGFLQNLLHGAGWRVTDAVGVSRGLYDYFQISGERPVSRRVFASVRRECSQYEEYGARRLMDMLLALFVFGACISAVRGIASGESVAWAIASVVWAALWLVIGWGYTRLIRCGPAAYARELVAHGHCGACGYPLAQSGAELTTCTECGAAWRSEEVGVEPEQQAGPQA